MENSIWGTSKTSTENKSVWGTMSDSEPVQPKQQTDKNVIAVDHVYKAMPIFSTIFEDHVEFNQYMKQVILEHRQNNPESNNSNVKAWHSSWKTHLENPKFQPIVDTICKACYTISSQLSLIHI